MKSENGRESGVHEVSFIFDVEFSGDLWALSRGAHVWLIKSEHNDRITGSVWDRETEPYSPMHGVSTFGDASDPTSSFYSFLGTIDQHHDEFSAPRPWDVIHVIGLALEPLSTEKIANELLLESAHIEKEAGGFAIRRPE